MRRYAVFHDESKEDGFWHIFFWVPIDFFEELVEKLSLAQKNSGFAGREFSFKNLKSKASYRCAEYWLTILKASLHNQKLSQLVDFDLGRIFDEVDNRRKPLYQKFSKMPCCKVNMFYLPNGHRDLNLCKDETSRIETTFRMGLKGGAHYLFSRDNPCEISNVWIDREKHYQRPLEKEKLFSRLQNETRDYIVLSDDCRIEGEDVPEKERLILDAVDILLGSFRHAHVHGTSTDSNAKVQKYKLTRVTHDLLTRLEKGHARMKNSRFYTGYSLSQAELYYARLTS